MFTTITTVTYVIEGHTMQHNIKRRNGVRTNTYGAPSRMIGLRLPNDEYIEVQKMAKEQDRSIASLARICMRLGIEQLKKGA